MTLETSTLNFAVIFFKYLRIFKLKIGLDSVIQELERHPDYPSLLALNYILHSYELPADAYRVSLNDKFDSYQTLLHILN